MPFHWVAGLFSMIPAVCIGYSGHGLPNDRVERRQLELTRQLGCWTVLGPQTMLNKGIIVPSKTLTMSKLRVQTVQGLGSASVAHCMDHVPQRLWGSRSSVDECKVNINGILALKKYQIDKFRQTELRMFLSIGSLVYSVWYSLCVLDTVDMVCPLTEWKDGN